MRKRNRVSSFGGGRVTNETRFRVLALTGLLVVASDARADIVFFSTGKTMSVAAHRVEGETVVLSLRDGGEVVCPRAIVARIAPDEVPYPDPPVADAAAVVAEVPRPEQTAPEKSQPFAELISAVAAANEVDARLVHAIVDVESSYQPRASRGAAVSRRGRARRDRRGFSPPVQFRIIASDNVL
ncbi:MAG: hypothetical protein LC791_02795 [Acidobacteria bacterium]|nr:hypothetical protein [Acidobacteriota bacterium]